MINGLPDGVTRHWHANGQLATEIPLTGGIVNGTVRQWNESGGLLGSFEMIAGTGVYRIWYGNGQLMNEMPSSNGRITGRERTFLEDGTLVKEQYWLDNKKISKKRYREACSQDPNLPTYEGEVGM